ncbi:MAG: trans-2,3-dihydro-3-hydroxyanthranilate isomerase [Hyphomicrobiaceae bacterium]
MLSRRIGLCRIDREALLEFKFHTLDVFTQERFGGNPLAVVHGADDLSTEAMQTIAAEFNLSETVFVMKAEQPAHSAKVRIFTPKSELPFAGHPTVGTAVLLAELRATEAGGGRDALVMLEENIGLVRAGVRIGTAPGLVSFAEFDGPKIPVMETSLPDRADIAAAVGLIPGEIGFANHQPTIFDAGARILFVPVGSRAVLAKAGPNLSQWSRALGVHSDIQAYVYCNQPEQGDAHYRARMFAPSLGILEDPATGGAAAAFAGVVKHFDDLRDGMHKRHIEQGYEMGRPSQIELSLEVAGGKLTGFRIGGYAVRVSEGTITV